jgi:hypothetical protein
MNAILLKVLKPIFGIRTRENMTDLDLDELRDELADFAKPKKQQSRSQRDERIIAGFKEIQRFVEEHGHAPQSGEDKDIFERIYATRLEQIRKQPDCVELVKELDTQGLLDGAGDENESSLDDLGDDELLAELEGIGSEADDLRDLKHVKPRAEVRAAEEIANRKRCDDFHIFKPVFDAVQDELGRGIRQTRPFKDDATVKKGNLFILSGQKVYIAEMGETFHSEAQGRYDARLRVVYDNGTESDLLMTSLQRALQKDDLGRRISDPTAGPLFSGERLDDDQASGTVYVLRSKSDLPFVDENRNVLHKIGVTGGSVEKRIANASHEATFLLADVEVVATYELYNINRSKLEGLLHKIFDVARVDIEIKDRFGMPVRPEEWFLVPLFVIKEAMDKVKDGTITDYKFNPESASLELRE